MASAFLAVGRSETATPAVPASAKSVLIGRGAALVPTTDKMASRRHAQIWREDGEWRIRDLGSRNGTYVNGVRITDTRRLMPDDRVGIGRTELRFEASPAEPEARVVLSTPDASWPAPDRALPADATVAPTHDADDDAEVPWDRWRSILDSEMTARSRE